MENKKEKNTKKFEPAMAVFDPFKVPFVEKSDLVFDARDMDACCACTACTACK